MSRHVVRPFGGVHEIAVAIRNQSLHENFKIPPYIGVSIFTQHQRCTRVMKENIADSGLDRRIRYVLPDLVSDIDSATSGSVDGKPSLNRHTTMLHEVAR